MRFSSSVVISPCRMGNSSPGVLAVQSDLFTKVCMQFTLPSARFGAVLRFTLFLECSSLLILKIPFLHISSPRHRLPRLHHRLDLAAGQADDFPLEC